MLLSHSDLFEPFIPNRPYAKKAAGIASCITHGVLSIFVMELKVHRGLLP